MTRKWATCLLLLTALSAGHARAASKPGIAIMAWNVYSGLDKTDVRSAIVGAKPDVVFAMEAQDHTELGLLKTDLTNATGVTWYVLADTASGTLKHAILSRFPLSATEVIKGSPMQKPVLKAKISAGGDELTLFGLHARTASTATTHASESDKFLSVIGARTSHARTVVIGDFNSRSALDGAVHDTSDPKYATTEYSYPNTYSTGNFANAGYCDTWRFMNPDRAVLATKMRKYNEGTGSNLNERIDYCLVSSDMASSSYILDAGIDSKSTNYLSDHKPVWVRLKCGTAMTDGGIHTDSTPMIWSSTLGPGNKYLDVTFTEDVFANAAATTPLTMANVELTFEKHSAGSATACAITSVKKPDSEIESSASPLSGGETTIRVFLSVTGTPNGQETIKLHLAGAIGSAQKKTPAHIYNAAGVSDCWSRLKTGKVPFAGTGRTNYHNLKTP